MKLLIWGCSNRIREFIKRIGLLERIDADFTDSDRNKWGKEIAPKKYILALKDLNANEYDCCLIGSETYEKEIEEAAIKFGFKKKQIVPPAYIVSEIVKWRKIYTLKTWKETVEDESITVLKNWYCNDGKLECILKISNAWNEILNVKILCVKAITNVLVQNVTTGAETVYSASDMIECPLYQNEEIIKISVDSMRGIPWMILSKSPTEIKKTIITNKRYDNFINALNNMNDFYFHDEDYLALRKFKRSGTIIDVGANYGQSMHAFYKLTNSKIISVEPVPDLCEILECYRKCFDTENRVKVINAGVADKNATLIWYEPENKGYSGSFDKSFMDSRKLDMRIEETVLPCTRMDDMFMDIDDIWFIKMDVEGMEYKAIVGGMEIIKKTKPILLLEENTYKSAIYELLKEWYDLKYYDYDNDRFCDDRKTGINYWLIPKNEMIK